MGNPLEIAITLDKNNDLKFLSYDHYDMKKINKRYRLKNAIDILVDIKLNNNVFIETADGSSDYTGKDGNDVVIDSVEVVYDYPQYVDEYKHIVPYYVLSGTKKQGDAVRITMPAIKNRYLWVKN
jgi:hypothetical protein